VDPLRWRKPRRVFVNSMSDLFHEELSDDSIDRVFAVMALAPQHQFQILTKRPQRMLTYLANPDLTDRLTEIWQEGHRDRATWTLMLPLENVWLGVSVEDQATADERIPLLLQTPAAVRFVSAEPLLGPVDLSGRLGECCGFPKHELVAGEDHEVCCGNHSAGLDWAVVGGESGPGARPMQIEWAQSLQRQCGEASVPFFMKQLDGKRKKLSDFPGDLRVREFPA
jgi:protein gp37